MIINKNIDGGKEQHPAGKGWKDAFAAHTLGLYNDIKGDSDEEYRHCRIDRQLLFVQKPHLLLKIAS